MADAPQALTLKRHRDLVGRKNYVWVRRGLLALLAALLVVALLNVFGQRPQTSSAVGSGASLSVYSPQRVRSGLYYEARFHIRAQQEIKKAQLVLGAGWLEGITINTIEPSPIGEGSRNGSLVLELGHIPAGQTYLLFMQSQVNPTNVGRRQQAVELYDGEKLLASLKRPITIFP